MALTPQRVDNVRITLSLSMCFPITDAETEDTNTARAREPRGLTDNQTQVGFIYYQVSVSLSSNWRVMMLSWVPRYQCQFRPHILQTWKGLGISPMHSYPTKW